MKATRASISAVAFAGFAGAALGQPSFVTLPAGFVPHGLSGDGHVVVGRAQNLPARWTMAGGLEFLASAPGGTALAASFDGSVVVGSLIGDQAFRWSAGTTQVLGPLPGMTGSVGEAVTNDGVGVVGNSFGGAPGNQVCQPWRWMQATGAVQLAPGGGISRAAIGASADASVVLGQVFLPGVPPSTVDGWRWTQATGYLPLAPPAGYSGVLPASISADGHVIGGSAQNAAARVGMRWIDGVPQVMGTLNNLTDSRAYGVSGDGSVIVGRATDFGLGGYKAWIWRPAPGIANLKDVLWALGATTVADWHLTSAEWVSHDGRITAGSCQGAVPPHPYAYFVAVLDEACYPDCNADGSLSIADFGCFQSKFVASDPYADCNASGTFTIADFACFQSAFVGGCP